MDETLRKIELIIERTHVTYAQAKAAYDHNGGSVVDAIIELEQGSTPADTAPISPKEDKKRFWHEMRGLVQKSRKTKILVMKEGRQVAEVPASAGVIGMLGAVAVPGLAVVGAIGSVAALMNKYSLEVQGSKGEGEREEEDERYM